MNPIKTALAVMVCVMGMAQTAIAADTVCTGTLGAITVPGNLVVPARRTCTLNGTEVVGDVTVRSNGVLNANAAVMNQNLNTQGFSSINLLDTLVLGSFQTLAPSASSCSYGTGCLVFEGTYFGGDVLIGPAASTTTQKPVLNCLSIDASDIGGDLVINSVRAKYNSTAIPPSVEVINSFIGGDMLVTNMGTAGTCRGPQINFNIDTNRVNGSFLFQSNAINNTISGNTAAGDMSYLCNRSPGSLTNNDVGGNLAYQSTAPVPTVSGNFVGGTTTTVACTTP